MSIRSKAPAIQTVKELHLIEPTVHRLDNEINVYELAIGTQDILHIELVWDAGRWYEPKPLVARTTARMLKAGTALHDAEAIAGHFDFYGTKLNIEDDFDVIKIGFYCLTKHLEPLLAMLQEILMQPSFPQDELDKFIKRQKQRLKLQLQENDTLAFRALTELLYGAQHPYGYNSTPEYYDALTISELEQYYKEYFTADRCRIIVSGKSDARVIALINQYLGGLPKATQSPAAPTIPAIPIPTQIPPKQHLPAAKEPSLQVSIRIGRRAIGRHHPDFHELNVLNTILGGYFGARLMQNLREENGYTYGIYSSIETMRHEAYLYISTDVGNEVKEASLTEIYLEIERLKVELVDEEELEMVKSYSLGMLLSALDGAFKLASIWRELLSAELSPAFFKEYVAAVRAVTPARLQELAKKYLCDWCEVVVG